MKLVGWPSTKCQIHYGVELLPFKIFELKFFSILFSSLLKVVGGGCNQSKVV